MTSGRRMSTQIVIRHYEESQRSAKVLGCDVSGIIANRMGMK